MSGGASALDGIVACFGALLRYFPTPQPFAVGVCLLAPAGLLNQLPMPSSSMSGGPASFSACTTCWKNQREYSGERQAGAGGRGEGGIELATYVG